MEKKKVSRKNVYWDKPETNRHTFDSKLSEEEKIERAKSILTTFNWSPKSVSSYLGMPYSKVQDIHKELMKTDREYKDSCDFRNYF